MIHHAIKKENIIQSVVYICSYMLALLVIKIFYFIVISLSDTYVCMYMHAVALYT